MKPFYELTAIIAGVRKYTDEFIKEQFPMTMDERSVIRMFGEICARISTEECYLTYITPVKDGAPEITTIAAFKRGGIDLDQAPPPTPHRSYGLRQ